MLQDGSCTTLHEVVRYKCMGKGDMLQDGSCTTLHEVVRYKCMGKGDMLQDGLCTTLHEIVRYKCHSSQNNNNCNDTCVFAYLMPYILIRQMC